MEFPKFEKENVWATQLILRNSQLIKIVFLGDPESVRAVRARFFEGHVLMLESKRTGFMRIGRNSAWKYTSGTTFIHGTPYIASTLQTPEMLKALVGTGNEAVTITKELRNLSVPFLMDWYKPLRNVFESWFEDLIVFNASEHLRLLNLPTREEILTELMPHVGRLTTLAEATLR